MSFGSRLRERRESLKFNQSELAKRLGVTRAAVGNYESGARLPHTDILYKIFDALNCDANYLFQDGMKNVLSDEKQNLFSFEEFAKAKGASDQEIKILKAYFELDPKVRHGIIELFRNSC